MSAKQNLVLIGNGMAGIYTLERILEKDPDKYQITVFGAERHPNYNRILLSTVLSQKMDIKDIVLNDINWYRENNITLHLNKTVENINRAKKTVQSGDMEVPYDRLIIATGSNPVIIPFPGVDKEGVVAFRNIEDCQRMIDTAKKYKKAVVIGGGLLGLEAAYGLIQLGMEVKVVHLMDRLMERQLDAQAAGLLKENLENQGMEILLEKNTEAILGNGRVEGVKFKDGTEVDADLLVMAVGIQPNIELAKKSGIYCERGIVVSDTMLSYDPAIYAVGECAQHRGNVYGLVAPLFEQGKAIANQLAGDGSQDYGGSVLSTKLKVSGVEVFSAGEFLETEEHETISFLDQGQGVYKKLVIKDDKIVGAVMFGDTGDGPSFFQMMIDQKDISEQRNSLLFGAGNLGDTGHSGLNQAAAMLDDAIVCGCNGVSKGAIVKAIREEGLFTREEVKNCTKASGSCGGCASLVEQILESIQGPDVEATRQKLTLCKCTVYSRDETVQEIRSKGLTNVREVMNVLEWETEGCGICRPAINYFIKMVWPEEAEDDSSSQVANERHHANIQKDATYSVVPRIYGGVTSPDQLRRIADVADKYQVPMVKITGAQRIDLLGVKKENLPKMWKDLGMPSGSAYAKSVRTVKSCVGSDFCRFGVQDSIQMAIDIEKKIGCLNTPAKVKMAVSGCPRNCAESSIKDLGIVGIYGGWELYVGGNGGVKVRAGDLLCTVKTREEVQEVTDAYLQHYRENGNYLERTSHWLERVGLDSIKKAVVEDLDNRKALLERLNQAVNVLEDPWAKLSQKEKESSGPSQFNGLKSEGEAS